MNYHFTLHAEEDGLWAECCELDGCLTQGDTREALIEACKEALDVYLYEPVGSKRVFPPPNDALEGKTNILSIPVDPGKTAALVRHIHKAGSELTLEEREAARRRIAEAAKYPIVFDKDCPKLRPEQLAEFRPAGGMSWEERARRMREAGLIAPEAEAEETACAVDPALAVGK